MIKKSMSSRREVQRRGVMGRRVDEDGSGVGDDERKVQVRAIGCEIAPKDVRQAGHAC